MVSPACIDDFIHSVAWIDGVSEEQTSVLGQLRLDCLTLYTNDLGVSCLDIAQAVMYCGVF